jgi:hypothetical protein
MFPRLIVTVLLAGLALPAFCQKPQTAQATPIPDYIVYDAFFYRVKWLNDLADKYDSRGKAASAGYFRSTLQRTAGLTAQEEAAVKAIAADWRAGDLGIVNTEQALAKAGATPNDLRLKALALQRQQLVASHVSQLRAAMGAARFQQLDSFVRVSSTVKGAAAAQVAK